MQIDDAMIERVAIALALHDGNTFTPERACTARNFYDELSELEQDEWRDAARVAIKAAFQQNDSKANTYPLKQAIDEATKYHAEMNLDLSLFYVIQALRTVEHG